MGVGVIITAESTIARFTPHHKRAADPATKEKIIIIKEKLPGCDTEHFRLYSAVTAMSPDFTEFTEPPSHWSQPSTSQTRSEERRLHVLTVNQKCQILSCTNVVVGFFYYLLLYLPSQLYRYSIGLTLSYILTDKHRPSEIVGLFGDGLK